MSMGLRLEALGVAEVPLFAIAQNNTYMQFSNARSLAIWAKWTVDWSAQNLL